MPFASPSHAWAVWLDRLSDLTLVEQNARDVRSALDALAAGDLVTARTLWTSVPGDLLLDAWNEQIVAMRDKSRWPDSLHSFEKTQPKTVKKLARPLSTRIFKRDRYRCGYCGIPVVTQWQGGDIPRLVAAFPDVTPHLQWDNGSIFKHSSPTNENCAKWLWITAVADHIHPASDGGPTEPHNLITACAGCNYGKVDWTLEQLDVRQPELPAAL